MGKPFKSRLLIVAASARPWIRSAEIAGFCVTAFDFFRDWDSIGEGGWREHSNLTGSDVAQKRTVIRLERFEDLVKQSHFELISKCDYAILAGGIENHPSIIEALASRIPILGPDAFQHDRMSDTVRILSRLKEFGFQVPESSLRLGSNTCPGEWLKKSFRSSSGLGIRQATEDDVGLESNLHYYQKKVSGESFSGFFISVPEEEGGGCTALVGWTRQLVNEQWCAAGEFRYCGSIGPLSIDESLKNKIEAIGQAVADEYGIIGAWGIDFLVDGSNVSPVDFNVRLTASMEIFDARLENSQASHRSVVELHTLACLGQLDLNQFKRSTDMAGLSNEFCFGKSIVFYDGLVPLQITETIHRNLISQWRLISAVRLGEFGVADIPNLGEWIRPGQPICTILANAEPRRVAEVLEVATAKIRRVLSRLESAQ
ncbi:ATP-grasp domain-containing protein [Mariniblastus sp.]|nr:ATP-grasp domain-containing protein [Mariniblastus sp.]